MHLCNMRCPLLSFIVEKLNKYFPIAASHRESCKRLKSGDAKTVELSKYDQCHGGTNLSLILTN